MRQSFAWWAFAMGLPEHQQQLDLLRSAADMGYAGVEMLPEALWPAAREVGLELPTIIGHEIERGFNDPSLHAELTDTVATAIEGAAAGGVSMVIVFSGNRAGRSDAEGVQNCIAGLGPLADTAAQAGVTLILELLNSKADHPDYHCDSSSFGFEVVRGVDSPALRVLYDAYHMQLMEGDLLNTIKANLDLIGHVHTAGAPGRRDLDDRQEVNWAGIAGTLRHKGYDGWVGHEFMPRQDPVDALRAAHAIFAAST